MGWRWKEGHLSAKKTHIKIRYFFIKEQAVVDDLDIKYFLSVEMVAEFPKNLYRDRYSDCSER